jgi:hypothetical protein
MSIFAIIGCVLVIELGLFVELGWVKQYCIWISASLLLDGEHELFKVRPS